MAHTAPQSGIRVLAGLGGAAAALVCALASAQQPPETTGSPRPQPPPLAEPAPPPPVERPDAEPPPGAGGVKTTVKRFVFQGNTAFPEEAFAPVVAGYLHREIALAEIYEAADAVTDFYVARGYSLASVVVPAQKIADGVVKLQVVEGRIGATKVEGVDRYPPAKVERVLGDLPEGKLYRGEELESGLRRVNRLPGLTAKAVLEPGKAFGTTDIIIKANEQPWTAAMAADNHGRENLGEIRGSVRGVLNSPLLSADQVQLLYLHSQNGLMDYGSIGYSTPLPANLRLNVNYGEANFEVAGFAGVEGENKTSRASLEYWLLDERSDSLVLAPGAVRTEANTDLIGTPISERELTLAELSALFTRNYSVHATTQVSLTLQSSFGGSSATDCPTSGAPTCDDVALRWELDAQHVQPLWGRLDGYVHVNYAGSQDPLPDISQVSLGGPNSVRAYPAAEVRGDRGLLASAGVRQRFFLGRAILAARAFADAGQVECEVACASGVKSDALSSAGVGFDALLGLGKINLSGKIDWSFALDEPSGLSASSDDDQRVFGMLAVTY